MYILRKFIDFLSILVKYSYMNKFWRRIFLLFLPVFYTVSPIRVQHVQVIEMQEESQSELQTELIEYEEKFVVSWSSIKKSILAKVNKIKRKIKNKLESLAMDIRRTWFNHKMIFK